MAEAKYVLIVSSDLDFLQTHSRALAIDGDEPGRALQFYTTASVPFLPEHKISPVSSDCPLRGRGGHLTING